MTDSSESTKGLVAGARDLLREAVRTSLFFFKIMIPVLIVTKLLQEAGLIERCGALLGPVMKLVGLPGGMGLVWATAMITNLYGGMVVFASLAPQYSLTVAQSTVLTTMMLVAHGLPLELRIAQKAGPRLRFVSVLRVAGALLLGWLLHQVYSRAGFLQGPNEPIFKAVSSDPSWPAWARDQLRNLGLIFLIILGLLFLMRVLKRVGVTDLLTRMLRPVLRVLGMSRDAAPITIVGMTMGISYGGALIIQEAQSGRLSARDVFFSLALMSLCHSLIEDTLLMTALGGHVSGVLLGRLLFALVVTALLVKAVGLLPEGAFERYLARPPGRKNDGA